MKKVVLAIAGTIVKSVIRKVTPELRGLLVTAIGSLEIKAAASDNKYDDELIVVLKVLLGIE